MQRLYSRLILQRLRHSLLIVAAIVFSILAISTVSLIYSNRSDQMTQAGHSIKSMAAILSKESDATLTLAATILEELSTHLKIDSDKNFLDTQQIYNSLKSYRSFINEQTGTHSFSHLFLVDKDGYSVANSVSFPSRRIDASDRKYFTYHQEFPGKNLHISPPRYSKVTGERVIFLTRRVSDEHGNFCGVIGIQLKLSHFDRMYQQLEIPPEGSVTVIRSDGQGIYRYPMIETFLNTSVKDVSAFQEMLQKKSGYLHALATPYDGFDRLVGYKLSEKFPIANLITVTEDSLLENWESSSIKILLLAGFAAMTLLVMVYFTYQQLGFLDQAIQLSNHDPLTSLYNRRALDDHLEEEWRRVRRRGGHISMLFIDIDYFKNYNDFYGHSKGDLCLKYIARAIAQFAERSGEMVSRYGGEEFIVLLPESDHETAYNIADRIIRAILELNIPHANSLITDRVTVSIGVATVKPEEGLGVNSLFDQADDALYQAKAKGRNQIQVYKTEQINT